MGSCLPCSIPYFQGFPTHDTYLFKTAANATSKEAFWTNAHFSLAKDLGPPDQEKAVKLVQEFLKGKGSPKLYSLKGLFDTAQQFRFSTFMMDKLQKKSVCIHPPSFSSGCIAGRRDPLPTAFHPQCSTSLFHHCTEQGTEQLLHTHTSGNRRKQISGSVLILKHGGTSFNISGKSHPRNS